MPRLPPEEMEWAGLEVTEADTAPQHPASFAKMVGLDVCVLAAAWPAETLERPGSIGWCAKVTAVQTHKSRQEVRVFGHKLDFKNQKLIRPLKQYEDLETRRLLPLPREQDSLQDAPQEPQEPQERASVAFENLVSSDDEDPATAAAAAVAAVAVP